MTDPTPSTAGTFLRGCGLSAAIAAGLVVLLLVIAYLQFRSQFRASEGVPVAVVWDETQVRLSSEQPAMQGRLAIVSPTALASNSRFGITIDVPDPDDASPAAGSDLKPADVLRLPPVRLTVMLGQGTSQSCLAPCELSVAPPSCTGGACRTDLEVRVERIGATGASSAGGITVDVAAGVTAALRQQLPAGLSVELTVDQPAPARGS